MTSLTFFKAYDIRGQLGAEFNEDIAYRICRAYAQFLQARQVVETLTQALANGLMAAGCDVIDIGMTGTEEVYFAAFYLDVDGGIEVTASHNLSDFNGMILWLLVAELMNNQGKKLSDLVGKCMAAFPCDVLINYVVLDSKAVLYHYAVQQPTVDAADGISLEFAECA